MTQTATGSSLKNRYMIRRLHFKLRQGYSRLVNRQVAKLSGVNISKTRLARSFNNHGQNWKQNKCFLANFFDIYIIIGQQMPLIFSHLFAKQLITARVEQCFVSDRVNNQTKFNVILSSC